MKSTIHTIKDRVRERLSFSISDEHYYQILEGYFLFVKEQIESFNYLEVDNPLGTFVMREKELKDKSQAVGAYFKNGKLAARKALISKVSSLLNLDPKEYKNLTDEQLKELHDLAQKRIVEKLEQLHHIYKHKKLTKSSDGEDNIE